MTYEISDNTIEDIKNLKDEFDIHDRQQREQIQKGIDEVVSLCYAFNGKLPYLEPEGAEKTKHHRRHILGSAKEKGTFMNLLAMIVDSIEPGNQETEGFLIDPHVHMKPTRRKPYDGSWVELCVRTAKAKGLHGIVLVEHYYARGTQILRDVQNLPSYDDFVIFPGIEANIHEEGKYHGHVLVVGNYLNLKRFVESVEKIPKQTPPTKSELFLTLNQIGRENFAVIGAHIFDHNWRLCHPDRIEGMGNISLSAFDAIDHKPESFDYNAQARKAAEKYKVPILTCSDAHVPFSVGNWASCFEEKPDSVEDFISQLKSQKHELETGKGDPEKFIPEDVKLAMKTKEPAEIKKQVALAKKIRRMIKYIGLYHYKISDED